MIKTEYKYVKRNKQLTFKNAFGKLYGAIFKTVLSCNTNSYYLKILFIFHCYFFIKQFSEAKKYNSAMHKRNLSSTFGKQFCLKI